MFGKLVKYEMRHLVRIFVPMWAAVLALCVFFRLSMIPETMHFRDGGYYVEGSEAILPVIMAMLAVFAIMTMMVVAAVVLIQRFGKGMYGDEGYLMFTLPVTTGQLIHSKALCAMIMLLATEFITMLGMMLMMSFRELWAEVPQAWDMILQMLEYNGITPAMMTVYGFWGAVAGLIVLAEGIYMLYLAISVGQLWKKHPVAGGILAFYGINMLISAFEAIVGFQTEFMFMENIVYKEQLNALLLYVTVRGLILLVISFAGTKLILDKKLNIQ